MEFRADSSLLHRIHEPLSEKWLNLDADLGPRFLAALTELLSYTSASMTISSPQTYEDDQSASILVYLLSLIQLFTGTNDTMGESSDRLGLETDRTFLKNRLKDLIKTAWPQLGKASEAVKIPSDKCCYHMVSVELNSTQYTIEIKRLDVADDSVDHLQSAILSNNIQMTVNQDKQVQFINLAGNEPKVKNCRSFLKQVGLTMKTWLTL